MKYLVVVELKSFEGAVAVLDDILDTFAVVDYETIEVFDQVESARKSNKIMKFLFHV